MAKVELNSIIERLRSKMGETPSDEELTLLEDVTDTFNGLSTSDVPKDTEDWKAKYDENDKQWRQRYADRFNGKIEGEQKPTIESIVNENKAEQISIDDLFTEKE